MTAEKIKEAISGIGNSLVQNLTELEKQGGDSLARDYYSYELEKTRKIVCQVILFILDFGRY